jgi:hypothetical protein
LKLPNNPQLFPGFQAHRLKCHIPNDPILFRTREPGWPGPVITPNGAVEWTVDKIVDEHRPGRGKQYLVCWEGYGAEWDEWVPGRDMQDTIALDVGGRRRIVTHSNFLKWGRV